MRTFKPHWVPDVSYTHTHRCWSISTREPRPVNYSVSQKTVHNCFCQNFVIFLLTLITFGTKMTKRIKLC